LGGVRSGWSLPQDTFYKLEWERGAGAGMQSEASWFYCPYKRGRDPIIALYVTCAEDDGFLNIEFREDAVSCIFAWPIGKQVYTATLEATPSTSVTSIKLYEMVTEELVDVPWQDFATRGV
jgi:hypothetical protein